MHTNLCLKYIAWWSSWMKQVAAVTRLALLQLVSQL